MSETNEAKSQYVMNDIDVRIQRKNDSIGFQTTSQLQLRIDHVNRLNEGYKPAIEGLDAKIVSIGQSINQIKDEIVDLVTAAVGLTTTNSCASLNVGVCTGWSGGVSTCLTGYAVEYYDTVNAHIWPLSSTSNNPFSPKSYSRLTNASNEYTAGIGSFMFRTILDILLVQGSVLDHLQLVLPLRLRLIEKMEKSQVSGQN